MKFTRLSAVAASVAMAAVIGLSGETATLAQGPTGGGFGGRPSINVQAFNACTTTNYGDIAAKALNTTSAAIRKALVAGQTFQEIAKAANVDIKTVSDAVAAARKTEIDQAVTDGVITQAEGTALEATPSAPAGGGQNGNGTPPAGGRGNGGGGNGGGNGGGGNGGGRPTITVFPDISTFALLLRQDSGATPAGPGGNGGGRGGAAGFGGGFGGISPATFNMVKQYEVAATALNMKCADVVKTLITPPGMSLLALSSKQNVDPQAVKDALTKAYKDALAQDVTDGVITQAQSDTLTANLDAAVTGFVGNPLPMGQQPTPTPGS